MFKKLIASLASLASDGLRGLLKSLSEVFYQLSHKDEIEEQARLEKEWSEKERLYQAKISNLNGQYNDLSREKAQIAANLQTKEIELESLQKQLQKVKDGEKIKLDTISKQSDDIALRSQF